MVVCPDCGKEVSEDKFCKNCGAYISNIEDVKPADESSSELEDTGSVVEVASVDESDLEAEGSVVEVISRDESSVENNAVSTKTNRKINFCHNCGNKITGNYKFCPECGQDLNGKIVKSHVVAVNSSGEKNILLAIILSVFLPGLGQIYLGLDHKGAIFLIAYVISAILILILIGFLLCGIIWIWALVDTIISTNALNRGEEVNDKIL